ncbi:hypothetical protein CCP3SC1_800009 [Gammaproteobacteria bacterium]
MASGRGDEKKDGLVEEKGGFVVVVAGLAGVKIGFDQEDQGGVSSRDKTSDSPVKAPSNSLR